jgi:hypothetical protein
MNLLRRLFGGGEAATPAETDDGDAPASTSPGELDALERERELEIALAEQDRLDELQQRQLRYASYAWQPPVQGGERRADDEADAAT